MFDPMFVPPRYIAALIRFANTVLPRVAPLFGHAHAVRVEKEDLARLEPLRPHRALICPNHPTETDPIVLFWLAKLYRQPFTYLATRETLDGPRGWLLNRIGVYSVIRGFPDRESLRMSRRLLAEQDRKVVIFPEGQIYERNDQLLTFHTGVAQIGFWALDDLQKAGREPFLPLVPVAIRYRCMADPRPAIEAGLADLERTLQLPAGGAREAGGEREAGPPLDSYARLVRVGSRVLANIEREEGLAVDESAELGERIAAARRAALRRVANAAGTEVDESQAPADQLHETFNRLKAWVGVLDDEHTDYDERRFRHRLETAAPLFRDLLRLQNFIAMTGDYVAAEPTAERFLEVLGCLQLEVFGRVRHRTPLEALVRIGEPIRLEERYEEYRKSKRAVVTAVTEEMEGRIRAMLRETARHATPL